MCFFLELSVLSTGKVVSNRAILTLIVYSNVAFKSLKKFFIKKMFSWTVARTSQKLETIQVDHHLAVSMVITNLSVRMKKKNYYCFGFFFWYWEKFTSGINLVNKFKQTKVVRRMSKYTKKDEKLVGGFFHNENVNGWWKTSWKPTAKYAINSNIMQMYGQIRAINHYFENLRLILQHVRR